MLIDTHAHLWFEDFKNDLEEVLSRAKQAGVEQMIVPATTVESSKQAVELAKKYKGIIFAAVGVHPEELVGRSSNEETPFACRRALLDLQSGIPVRESPREIVAIGEIGTDTSTEELKNCMGEQKELFREQCELALELDLPVIIHTRNSLGETLEVLDGLKAMPRGQFHCYSHDEEGIKQVVERGFHVSFCGNITWSKRVAKLVSLVPDERLLLETDSPFMIPRVAKITKVPNSGPESSEPENTRNEPANVAILAQKIAELRGQSLDEIGRITTANAKRLFHL